MRLSRGFPAAKTDADAVNKSRFKIFAAMYIHCTVTKFKLSLRLFIPRFQLHSKYFESTYMYIQNKEGKTTITIDMVLNVIITHSIA